MNIRENIAAILHYQPYEKMPVVSFGYWPETLQKWIQEGHITEEEYESYRHTGGNGPGDKSISKKLGFDFNWSCWVQCKFNLFPQFPRTVLEERPDGSQIVMTQLGQISLVKPGVASIPADIGTHLTDRKVWEEEYLPRLKFSMDRIDMKLMESLKDDSQRTEPISMFCGSMIGKVRDILGVEHMCYLMADDFDLFLEIIDTLDNLCYDCVKAMLESGAKFDFAHYWEDICFKNGPLVIPSMFDEYVGPHYKRINKLINSYGIDIISLDSDGCIDSLIPTWINNGVNTMFPIEYGTWQASIAPWREKYGKELRGVGGMNKNVFSQDYKAIDKELERLRPLIELGGYIPCPDHLIAPDAIFENVQYYCDKMQNLKL